LQSLQALLGPASQITTQHLALKSPRFTGFLHSRADFRVFLIFVEAQLVRILRKADSSFRLILPAARRGPR
jgi:hypothetical protein